MSKTIDNFAIRITKFVPEDIGLIREAVGEDAFASSTLTLNVDASTAKKLLQYWQDNECAFNIKCRNKNFKSV